MSVLEIKKFNDPVLRKKAKLVHAINAETKKLIVDMIETLYASNGVGLAANQVGRLQSIIVFDVSENRANPMVLVNPVVLEKKGRLFEEEGCLSFPGINVKVRRARYLKIKGLDYRFKPVTIETEGLCSRVLQHETDHLEGKVFIDRLPLIKRIKLLKKIRKIKPV